MRNIILALLSVCTLSTAGDFNKTMKIGDLEITPVSVTTPRFTYHEYNMETIKKEKRKSISILCINLRIKNVGKRSITPVTIAREKAYIESEKGKRNKSYLSEGETGEESFEKLKTVIYSTDSFGFTHELKPGKEMNVCYPYHWPDIIEGEYSAHVVLNTSTTFDQSFDIKFNNGDLK